MFNETEKRVLKILGRRKMKLADVTEQFYSDRPTPMYPGITVAQTIRTIRMKCAREKLDWTIRSRGRGRGGSTVWKEKK